MAADLLGSPPLFAASRTAAPAPLFLFKFMLMVGFWKGGEKIKWTKKEGGGEGDIFFLLNAIKQVFGEDD